MNSFAINFAIIFNQSTNNKDASRSNEQTHRNNTIRWWKQCDRWRISVIVKNIPNFPLLFCKWVVRGAMITDKNLQRIGEEERKRGKEKESGREGEQELEERGDAYAAQVIACDSSQNNHARRRGILLYCEFYFRFFAHFMMFFFFFVRIFVCHLSSLVDGRESTNTRSQSIQMINQ